MSLDNAAGVRRQPTDATRPSRRRFLQVGAGCAVPLLAGGALAAKSATGVVVATPGAAGQHSAELLLGHIEEEVARIVHAMQGPFGVRGEHVRSLAANLDLTAVCLESQRIEERAGSAIRQRMADVGRDALVQDGLEAYGRVVADLAWRHGITGSPAPDAAQLPDALDRISAGGIRLHLRGHRARLHRLAAVIDRADANRGATVLPRPIRQKPGDDFLGYPEQPPPFEHLDPCEAIEILTAYMGLVAIILATAGMEVPAGIIAAIASAIDLLRRIPCKKDAVA